MVCRQGTTKTHSEVNDICAAMKVLSENDSLPMFLGTSGMVSQTPIYISDPIDGDSSEMNVRLKVIEESLDSVLKSVSLNSETLKNIHGFSKELSNTSNMNREEENINATSDVNSWSEVVSRNLKQPVTETNKGTTEKDGWITVPEIQRNPSLVNPGESVSIFYVVLQHANLRVNHYQQTFTSSHSE